MLGMIDDVFVIDSIVHAFNLAPDNMRSAASDRVVDLFYHGLMLPFSPRGRSEWVLDKPQFVRKWSAEDLAYALFAESQTDACIFHELPIFGLFKDGGSPLSVGREMRRRWPGRVALCGAVSPWQPDVFDAIDQRIEDDGVIGMKFCPMDLVDGELKSMRMDDEDLMFPLFDHIRKKGLRSVAVHKAVPLGGGAIEPFRVGDVAAAAMAFPDLTCEIVHGGFAYLEETAMHLTHCPNVTVNLEATSAYVVNYPRRFAEILGTLIQAAGGADRITWSSGCVSLHPRPMIDAFWRLEMPQDLIDNHGFPPLTKEMKRQILGGNQVRISGLDLASMRAAAAGDNFDRLDGAMSPWSVVRGVA